MTNLIGLRAELTDFQDLDDLFLLLLLRQNFLITLDLHVCDLFHSFQFLEEGPNGFKYLELSHSLD